MNLKTLRWILGVGIVLIFIALGICDIMLKRYNTGAISLLLSGVNGLIFFG